MIRLILLVMAVASGLIQGTSHAEPLLLQVDQVQLHTEDHTVKRVGTLRFLGGLQLKSPDTRFGGLSGLDVSDDGKRIRFVSDVGYWVQAMLRYGPAGDLAGIGDAEIGRLLAPDGKPVTRKRDADAESLALVGSGIAVAFERNHRVWIYPDGANPFLSRPRQLPIAPALKNAPRNKGAEAFAVLDDGSLVIVAENFPVDAPITHGWIRKDRRWLRFDYERTGLFQPTGATVLPDGDLLVLERRFTYIGGVASRLTRIASADLKPGNLVRSRELARLEPPLIVENFEGVDVRRDGQGRTLIYLVSDDNFNALQRTLLLVFILEPR